MSIWLVALSHFLHVAATIVWIGGIVMVLLVILPGAKAALESSPLLGKLMTEVTLRFTPLANISIFTLIGTGLIIFYYDQSYTSLMDINNKWNVILYVKKLLVAMMIIIHFYRGLILSKRIMKASTLGDEKQTAKLKKFSLNLVKTNFVLATVVLFLAAVSISI